MPGMRVFQFFVFFESFFKSNNCIPLKDFVFFELRFGFLMKNCIYEGSLQVAKGPPPTWYGLHFSSPAASPGNP